MPMTSEELGWESDSSFNSDLDVHVEKLAPSYESMQTNDKRYVVSNIKHMICQVGLGSGDGFPIIINKWTVMVQGL